MKIKHPNKQCIKCREIKVVHKHFWNSYLQDGVILPIMIICREDGKIKAANQFCNTPVKAK